MGNMLDYIRAFGGETFSHKPFNCIDNLVLSQLSYIDYASAAKIMPAKLASIAELVDFGVMNKNNGELYMLASKSARFESCLAAFYESELSESETEQFASVCFLLPDGTAFVSYRGTDSTLVGWKEDFMLSFTTPVPAQTHAVCYLNDIGRKLSCPLRVGGHSKGGNLAIYASAFCEKSVQKRIITVYSNDGPGFEPRILRTEEYLRIRDRIMRYIPESSTVGILMESDSGVSVVKSTGFGFAQHNPYTWLIAGDEFVTTPETSFASNMISSSQKDWFRRLSEEKRRYYTDTLFDILSAGNPRTVQEIRQDPSKLISALKAAKNLPQEDRANMLSFVKQLFSSLYAGGSAAVKIKYDEAVEFIKSKIGKTQ